MVKVKVKEGDANVMGTHRSKSWGCFIGGLGLAVGTLLVIGLSVPISQVDPATGHAMTLLQIAAMNVGTALVALGAFALVGLVIWWMVSAQRRREEWYWEQIEQRGLGGPGTTAPQLPPQSQAAPQPTIVFIPAPQPQLPPVQPYQPLPAAPQQQSDPMVAALLGELTKSNQALRQSNRFLQRKLETTEERWYETAKGIADICRDAMDRIAVAYQLSPTDRKFIEEGVADGVRLVRSRQDGELYLKTTDNGWFPASQYLLTDGAVKAMVKYQQEVDQVKAKAEEATYREI